MKLASWNLNLLITPPPPPPNYILGYPLRETDDPLHAARPHARATCVSHKEGEPSLVSHKESKIISRAF